MTSNPLDARREEPGPPGRLLDRLYAGPGVAPALVAVALALVLLLAFVVIAWVFGGWAHFRASGLPLWDYREARLAVMVAGLAGCLPAARRYVALGAKKNFEALRPLLGPSARLAPLDHRAARLAGAVGLLLLPLTGLVIDRDPTIYFGPHYWHAENGFAWVVGIFAASGWGRFAYETLAYGRRFSAVARDLGTIDLFDPGALAPFARQGLRSALLHLLLLSIISANALDWVWFLAIGALALAGGVAALILPIHGVHQRLCAAKQTELARVRSALRGEPAALAGPVLGGRAAPPGLADLLAYRQFVESVREWPLDFPILLRFGLYLALPLGSWLGGALVERLLGAALG